MAGPVTHVVLALSMLHTHFQDKDVKEFIVGSSFPDIRYLNVIKRDETHKKNVSMKEIASDRCAFRSGMHFHSLLDEVRSKYMDEKNVYAIVPKVKHISACLKFVEDRLMYNRIKNWKVITSYFNSALSQEIDFGISDKDIKKWHMLVKAYCYKKPTTTRAMKLYLMYLHPSMPSIINNFAVFAIKKLHMIPKDVTDLVKIATDLENNEKLKQIIFNFYDNFDKYVEKYQRS